MNDPSEEFIQIDNKKWNDIPALEDGIKILYDIVTLLIEKLTEQFIGVLCVESYDVRLDSEDTRIISDSQWLRHIHKGSKKSRIDQRPLVSPRHPKSLQRRVDYSWVVESCRNSIQVERILVSCGKFFYRELQPTSRSHRRRKRH